VAIQPIDLQVMFNQLDNVGKTQASQKDGLMLQQTLQNIQIQEKTEANIRSVNESQDTGDGAEAVNERDRRKQEAGEGKYPKKKKDKQGQQPQLWDPLLGKNIDISG
jgi:hypothetical protein